MLKAENLSFSYGSFSLEDVSIEVKEGEILSLLGPNGAGKSTLLKLMFGILRPHKGEVLVDGHNVLELPVNERAKKIGFVPQKHHPAFAFRAIDFVLLGAAPEIGLFGAPTRKHRKRAYKLLRMFGLEKYAGRPYTSLSGGQMQLLLIARALMMDPRYLLLDEPINHLDLRNAILVMKKIQQLAKNGVGVVMVLHDPNMAALFSDRVSIMKDGRILQTGTPEEILRCEVLECAYETKFLVVDDPVRVVVPQVV
ncbi:ABC transporter ATP-binding protein [Thermococcus indicus]|uniref:ABC transporter ATP-binding protein n=1 Tax=Thermococcus indicus TaxID=2586643 RepID=A0A4Y5SKK8_9EURY|nr:ABC transporter ATP-binding protein [Thermococcus indicus]QDA31376.1 ABC transporter ATP-binding protein [Thermococcus indicus]